MGFMADAREKYKDIIEMPHHVSKKRAHMSPHDRAVQFSPFAALTGFDSAIEEKARLTENQMLLDDETIDEIARKLKILEEKGIGEKIKITYFRPDPYKAGGAYISLEDKVKKIKAFERIILLEEKGEISFDSIFEIESYLFDGI